jgi:hypothetical protein
MFVLARALDAALLAIFSLNPFRRKSTQIDANLTQIEANRNDSVRKQEMQRALKELTVNSR